MLLNSYSKTISTWGWHYSVLAFFLLLMYLSKLSRIHLNITMFHTLVVYHHFSYIVVYHNVSYTFFTPQYFLHLLYTTMFPTILVGEPKLNIGLCLLCVCVCHVRCPLDKCDALISQQDNCTVTVSTYSTCVHTTVGTT